ncbi:hypothetical protein [Sphingomonas sp. LM7]|uniref:hypothetical protein n=1 Tax=Sphingomonas sp. LM7 TaxID=1938607 RepID=UPI0012372D99|nr:hypothetical protein [Sphingomonas sp. LM7]
MITAEIWPGGDKSRKHVIGEMRIANESDLANVSSYSVTTSQAADPGSGAGGWQSSLVIHGHRRSDGVWALVRAILDGALPNAARDERSIGEGKSDV